MLGDANIIPVDTTKVCIQAIHAMWLQEHNVSLDVLRLDMIHPVVSGNKWFKLQHYLKQASASGCTTVATFGGAWSNHIVAAAYTCKLQGLNSIGIIRGELSPTLSITLQQAKAFGMQLEFVSRTEYRNKEEIKKGYNHPKTFWINEGGYGINGMQGASEIVELVPAFEQYSHIIAAVGTGTMLAGLVSAANTHQQVIGISSMKSNFSLEKNIQHLLMDKQENFIIHHQYHFGGYGKHPQALINFINEVYTAHNLPLDIVYTGKTLFAIKELVKSNEFTSGSKLLMIHSGGLQGNSSLPAKVLAF